METDNQNENKTNKDDTVIVESKITIKQEEAAVNSFQQENENFDKFIEKIKENPLYEDYGYEYYYYYILDTRNYIRHY